jgi:hypothetical protein
MEKYAANGRVRGGGRPTILPGVPSSLRNPVVKSGAVGFVASLVPWSVVLLASLDVFCLS